MAAKKTKSVQNGPANLTTQRVDLDSLSRIKTVNYHLYKSKGIRMSQCGLIGYAFKYVLSREAEFIEYVVSEKGRSKRRAFDSLVVATGKPWFPYGNLVKVD